MRTPKRLALFIFLFFIASNSYVAAETVFTYHSINRLTGESFGSCQLRLSEVSDQSQGIWENNEIDAHFLEIFTFNTAGFIDRWEFSAPEHDTHYVGVWDGMTLKLNGTFQSKNLDKEIPIKKLPFYFNAKLDLKDFILSDRKTERYMTLRLDTATLYKMIAVKEGEETIAINGTDVLAQKVHISPTGMSAIFFSRFYWFRVSDGLYLKSEGSNNMIREMVGDPELSLQTF